MPTNNSEIGNEQVSMESHWSGFRTELTEKSKFPLKFNYVLSVVSY